MNKTSSIVRLVAPSEDREAECAASLEFDFLNGTTHQLQAMAKSDLAPEFSALFGDEVQCVLQGPESDGYLGRNGVDFTLSAEGYKNVSASTRASGKSYEDCLLGVRVFNAYLEPLAN